MEVMLLDTRRPRSFSCGVGMGGFGVGGGMREFET